MLAIEVDEVKGLAPPVVDMRNVQRSAYGTPETVLQIRRFFRRRPGERKRRRIQSRIADAVI